MMKTLTGISSVTAVASSCEVIWSDPSPARQTTVSPGQPIWAPSADGRPNPIVPSPPELIQRRGFGKWKYWAHHIWCWPTSEVTIASPPVAS
jgi:hypothetical protein